MSLGERLEDGHIEEVTQAFTLVQIVDVVMVTRGRREPQQWGEDCRREGGRAGGEGRERERGGDILNSKSLIFHYLQVATASW